MPRISTGDPKLDERASKLWESWGKKADATGVLDIYALQSLAIRSWLESGECFVRARARRTEDNLPVPLQLQVLEADYCPLDLEKEYSTGARVTQGIEFGPTEARNYYHFHRRHPGDTSGWSTETVRVEASQVAHLHRPTRPGQVRGVPWLAPVATTLRALTDYTESEAVRKKIEACMTAFVTTPEVDDYLTGEEDDVDTEGTGLATDADGNVIESLEPGLISYLEPGADVKLTTPSSTGGYSEYVTTTLYSVSGAVRTPYHLLTGDLSRTNYSSARVGELSYQRLITQLRNTIVGPILLDRIWGWFIDAAIASGQLPQANYDVKWAWPRFEAIDRAKEVAADILELRSGMASYQDLLARRMGDDWRETLREIAEANQEMDDLGVVLDIDARKTNKGGGYSPQPDAETESQ